MDMEGEAAHILGAEGTDVLHEAAEEIARPRPWVAYALFAKDGALRGISPQLSRSLAREALSEHEYHTVRSAGVSWRLKAFEGDSMTLVVAFDLIRVNGVIRDLLASYGLALPIVLLAAAFGGWWVAGLALIPVRRLGATAAAVQAASLDRRVELPPAKDEIRQLATVLNSMLQRLEASFRQSQQFAGDASHELRTPLTIMRGTVDGLLRTDGLSAEQERDLLSVQEEIGRLERITDQLLLLARFDGGGMKLPRNPVDFSSLVSEACQDAELLAAASELAIEAEVEDGLVVAGDAGHLRRLLLNLLDNAAKYNRPQGRIRVQLARAATMADLRIGNTGPGIPKPMEARVFERFHRGEESRAERSGHGLGLSLCHEIVQAHGGTIALTPDVPPDWTEFRVMLPLGQ